MEGCGWAIDVPPAAGSAVRNSGGRRHIGRTLVHVEAPDLVLCDDLEVLSWIAVTAYVDAVGFSQRISAEGPKPA